MANGTDPVGNTALRWTGRFAIGVVLVAGTTAAMTLARHSTDHSDEHIDYDRYCRQQHGADARAIYVTTDAAGWRCSFRQNGMWVALDVSVIDACREQLGKDSRVVLVDRDDQYGWHCRD